MLSAQFTVTLHDAGDNNVGGGPFGAGSSGGNAVVGGAGGDGGDDNGNTANGGDFNSGDFSGNGGIAAGDNGNGGNGGTGIGGESPCCKPPQVVLPAISSKVSAWHFPLQVLVVEVLARIAQLLIVTFSLVGQHA